MLIAMTLLSPQALHHARSIKRAAVAVISIVQVPMTVMTMILKILIVFQLLVVRITRLNQVIQRFSRPDNFFKRRLADLVPLACNLARNF